MKRKDQRRYLVALLMEVQEELLERSLDWPEEWDEHHLTWLVQRHVKELSDPYIWPGDDVHQKFTEAADKLEEPGT